MGVDRRCARKRRGSAGRLGRPLLLAIGAHVGVALRPVGSEPSPATLGAAALAARNNAGRRLRNNAGRNNGREVA